MRNDKEFQFEAIYVYVHSISAEPQVWGKKCADEYKQALMTWKKDKEAYNKQRAQITAGKKKVSWPAYQMTY